MIAQDVISHEIVTFDDLKPLATASGPCITMTVASAQLEQKMFLPNVNSHHKDIRPWVARKAVSTESASGGHSNQSGKPKWKSGLASCQIEGSR